MAYLQAGTYTFQSGKAAADRTIVPSGGTSIAVSSWSGTDYVADTDSPITSPGTIYMRSNRVRLVSDGAFFFDDEELARVVD